MKGLLLKDILVITKQMRVFIVLTVIFAVTSRSALLSFAVIYAAMMPMNALAYDERSKWNELAAMMPYSSSAMVLSKYILGYALVAAVTLLCTIVGLVSSRLMGGEGIDVEGIAVAVFIGLVFIAINLPFTFRLGVEKGRMANLIITMALVLSVSFFIPALASRLDTLSEYATGLAVAAFAAVIGLNAASIAYSASAYKKRFRN